MSDKQAPPVNKRPKCANCDKRLQPVNLWESRRVDLPGGGVDYLKENVRWSGSYKAYGRFCSLRCGTAWANAAIAAGVKFKGSHAS